MIIRSINVEKDIFQKLKFKFKQKKNNYIYDEADFHLVQFI